MPANSRSKTTRQLRPTATLYEASSQYRRWTFDSKKLNTIRKVVNKRAVDACKDHFKEEERLRSELPEGSKSTSVKTPEAYPTAADEAQLVRHYITSMRNLLALGILSDASGGRPIPAVVETIAITYLKRFYIRTSCLEYHPRSVMPVCLFLAGKAANHVFDIDRFAAAIDKLSKQDITEMEYRVLQTLKFDLYVQRVGHALHGWYLELQQDPDKDLARIDAAYQKAKGYLATSQLSDLEFTDTMSSISLACMRLADQELVDRVILSAYPEEEELNGQGKKVATMDTTDGDNQESNQESNQEAEKPARSRNVLKSRLEHIQSTITANVAPVEVAKIKTIDKIVRAAQDPSKNKKALLYAKRIRDEEVAQAEKRARKLAKAQREMSSKDMVFGPLVGQDGPHPGAHHLGESGMGIPAESGGLMFAGEGLRDVGMAIDDSDSD
ncbi:hypothetical protein NliqN6_2004 [Naganishia liquefaciens]|uniref:Cyclin-like domain-containing protein n=1 Tax=Naganishia liquefaciens TaxID=104408 RepID=A0A8H3YEU3_9TREE|nr:hypothetical protein NliqN6_2004 [Naganishia liquefaciens]